jgi:hypothetical protein
MRILVTGSRDWDDWGTLEGVLRRINPERGKKHWLIQGGARGADQLAFDAAQLNGWGVHTEPAKWEEHGRAAGMIRNQLMVNMNPDVCVVFRRNKSRGATDCGERAERAGIKTIWVEYEDLDS